jgi:hypothetical protein
LARVAAHAVYSQLEWVYRYYVSTGGTHRLKGATDVGQFRERVFAECPELEILWHAADASKHRDLTHPKHGPHFAATAQFMAGQGPVTWAADGREFRLIVDAGSDYWKKWPD